MALFFLDRQRCDDRTVTGWSVRLQQQDKRRRHGCRLIRCLHKGFRGTREFAVGRDIRQAHGPPQKSTAQLRPNTLELDVQCRVDQCIFAICKPLSPGAFRSLRYPRNYSPRRLRTRQFGEPGQGCLPAVQAQRMLTRLPRASPRSRSFQPGAVASNPPIPASSCAARPSVAPGCTRLAPCCVPRERAAVR